MNRVPPPKPGAEKQDEPTAVKLFKPLSSATNPQGSVRLSFVKFF
jgi:hypothetical protein